MNQEALISPTPKDGHWLKSTLHLGNRAFFEPIIQKTIKIYHENYLEQSSIRVSMDSFILQMLWILVCVNLHSWPMLTSQSQ